MKEKLAILLPGALLLIGLLFPLSHALSRAAPAPSSFRLQPSAFPSAWEPLTSAEPVRLWRSPRYAQDQALFITTGRELRRSTDDGDSWATLYTLPPETPGQLTAFAADPASNTLFLTRLVGDFHPAQVLRSTDGGVNWTAVFTSTTSPLYDIVAARDAMNRAVVFALGWGSVFRSTDGGDSWQTLTNGLPADADLYRLFISPTYAGDRTLYITGFGPLYRSTDGGDSWQVVSIPWADITRHVVFSPHYATDRTLWASYFWVEGSGEDEYPPNGVVRSTNGGLTWEKVNTGLPVDYLDGYVLGLDVSPNYPADPALYAVERTLAYTGTTWNLYRSPNGGDGWWDQGYLPDPAANPTGLLVARRDLLFLPTQRGLWRLRSCCWEQLRNGSAESNTDWEFPDTPAPAAYSIDHAHTGARSLRVGLVASPNHYAYSSARQLVSIPADAVTATLSFWLYPVSTETQLASSEAALAHTATPAAGDAQYVLVLDLAGHTLETLLWTRESGVAWKPYTFDLSAYAGQTVRLHFGVYNDGAGGITGMYVDDASLRACAPPPAAPAPVAPPNLGALGEDFLVSDAPNAQYDPALAYNPEDNEILFVWEDFRDTGMADLYIRRVSAAGRLLDRARPLVENVGVNPEAAYLAAADRYLAVWEDDRNVTQTPDIYGQLIDRAGQPVGAAFPIATGPGGQVSVRIAASEADASFLVVWGNAASGSSAVLGQRVGGDGSLLGAPLAISDGSGWAGQPALAYNAATASYWVVWADARDGFGDTDVYGQRLAADGALLGANFPVCTHPLPQEWPVVTLDGAGTAALVAWEDWRTGDRDLYGRQLALDGTPLADEFAVAAAPGNEEMLVATTWPAAGRDEFLLLWQTPGAAGDLEAQRYTPGGGPLGAPVLVSDEPHTQANPAVVAMPQADPPAYLVAWEDYRTFTNAGIYAQRLAPAGARLGLPTGLTPLDGSQTRPAVAYSAASDRYLAAWETHYTDAGSLMATTLSGAGWLAPYPTPVTTATVTGAPAVAWEASQNRFLVVWEGLRPGSVDDFNIYGRLFDAAGAPAGAEFIVSDAPGQQHAPAVACAPALARCLVVFQDGRDPGANVYGQFLSADGAPLFTPTAANLRISTPGGQEQREENPHVAYAPTQEAFVVVWQDSRDGVGLSRWDIYGRQVAADGALPGAEFAVAQQLPHNEHSPRLAYVAAHDTFLVVWEDVDMSVDGDPDVFGRVLAANGTPKGAAFPITATENWEGAPDVSVEPGSDYAFVVWYGGAPGGAAYMSEINGAQVRALRSARGSVEIAPLALAVDAASARWQPTLAAREGHGEWLILWEDGRADWGADHEGIYARRQRRIHTAYLPLCLRE